MEGSGSVSVKRATGKGRIFRTGEIHTREKTVQYLMGHSNAAMTLNVLDNVASGVEMLESSCN